MRAGEGSAVCVIKNALQPRRMTAPEALLVALAVAVQPLLDLLPENRFDDGWVLSLVELSLVGDAASVERASQDVIERPTTEGFAPYPLTLPIDPALACNAAFIEFVFQGSDAAQS
jgi:hypothetical protein